MSVNIPQGNTGLIIIMISLIIVAIIVFGVVVYLWTKRNKSAK